KLKEARLRSRFVAKRRKAREGKVVVDFRNYLVEAGLAEHHARTPDGIGQGLVVTRQSSQPASGQFIQIAHVVGEDVRVEPVGLGKYDVECNDNRTEI